MIDYHSHILPNMDDGSTSVEMSLTMLAQSKNQGVDTIIATPHFYGDRETPGDFLARREQTFTLLQQSLVDSNLPQIRLGAEVAYYPGLSHSDFLDDLCIQGTRLLLVELPFAPCTDRCYREISALSSQGYRPIIAHVERYLGLQPQRSFLDRLQQTGALIQCNASFFLQGWRSRKAFALLREGTVDVLGSDCHNLTTRAPSLGLAIQRLQEKLGQDFVEAFLRYGTELLD